MSNRSTTSGNPDANGFAWQSACRVGNSGHVVVSLPRLLTRRQAALYCGISVKAFDTHCPVRAISLGPDERLWRYDVRAIDKWIDLLVAEPTSKNVDWLQRIGDDDHEG